MQSLKLFRRSVNYYWKYNSVFSNSTLKPHSIIINRHKYTPTSGVKGIRNRKFQSESNNDDEEDTTENNDLNIQEDGDYDHLVSNAMRITKNILTEQRVLIIQPYIKWGPKKSLTSPELKLNEAKALVRSIPSWSIEHSLTVPLESLDKKTLFGTGKLEELKQMINKFRSSGKKISYVFVSKGTLSGTQKRKLESCFCVPVMDRYSVVIQILRLHATSMEAKLQVAMAELPYIWSQTRENENSEGKRNDFCLTDTQKEMLRTREKKLKTKLTNLRNHRELIRKKRKQTDLPIVAVVGYTNAGKTSLIKALTNEQSLQPRDQLFATLDVTAHAGFLPSKLKVVYMDTVGFMSDIPTGLIECFVATLEDAMLADLIIHVHDVSHENYIEQRKHVEQTLKSLLLNSSNPDNETLFNNTIDVGNKFDLINPKDCNKYTNLHLISSKTLTGVNDLLIEVERKILLATKRKKITIKVPMGGTESMWLYKNSAVTDSIADPNNSQYILLNVVISEAKLQQFRHYFIKK